VRKCGLKKSYNTDIHKLCILNGEIPHTIGVRHGDVLQCYTATAASYYPHEMATVIDKATLMSLHL